MDLSNSTRDSITDASAKAGVDYFNRGHWLTQIQIRYSLQARREMFDAWEAFARKRGNLQNQKLLDVGATPDCERQDSNCMIPWFHETGLQITLYSPEDISNLQRSFPFAQVLKPNIQNIGDTLSTQVQPEEYDWVCSSAVLEHVGSIESQKEFVSSCAKMGKGLFLTTPNRWHWLEFHTKIPLLHWLPKTIHRRFLRLLGKDFWAKEENLNLIDTATLQGIAQAVLEKDFIYEIRKVKALGMTSNLVLLAVRKKYARG